MYLLQDSDTQEAVQQARDALLTKRGALLTQLTSAESGPPPAGGRQQPPQLRRSETEETVDYPVLSQSPFPGEPEPPALTGPPGTPPALGPAPAPPAQHVGLSMREQHAIHEPLSLEEHEHQQESLSADYEVIVRRLHEQQQTMEGLLVTPLADATKEAQNLAELRTFCH